ncbi:NAD(P)-dependent oxidoreductase [Niabella soli]|uniref:3-beta hydroxysteroid dehydrogenase n=1 Tax=Niabella soli DSM 19437 TaxID=929713 RepID=W0EUS9_9BACT|nr:NAD(P)H-binding protein [Niabella soli]AHF14537.1 3-beta hydroxysteroid dehydrogenase [Niabella soli DSM 19437]
MKIAIIGATGFVGSAILKEALQRGHEVLALARSTSSITEKNPLLALLNIDVANTDELTAAIKGSDVVISAFNAGWTNPNLYNDFLSGSKEIEKAVAAARIKRLIVMGGAGSLYIDGIQLVDGPDFPEAYKQGAAAARDYLNLLNENKQLDWAFFSPAIEMNPGVTTGRTGKYRTGTDAPVFNAEGRSILSVEDLAVAVMDEAEEPRHIRRRFTAAY